MIQSTQNNYNSKSLLKKQNFAASKTLKQSSEASSKNSKFEEKSESHWKMKLERILNSKSKQDDYFKIVSNGSSSSCSCFNSNESRDTDSCGSDTDATRPDDIVIQLDEISFYNAKVNPFPQLNFPAIKKSLSVNTTKGVVVEDNQEKLPTDSPEVDTEIIDEINQVLEESTPAVDNPPADDIAKDNEVVEDNSSKAENTPTVDNPPEVDTKNDDDSNQLQVENSPSVDNPPVDTTNEIVAVEEKPENSPDVIVTNDEEAVEENQLENSSAVSEPKDEEAVEENLPENCFDASDTKDEEAADEKPAENPPDVSDPKDDENCLDLSDTKDEEAIEEKQPENSTDVSCTKDEETVEENQPEHSPDDTVTKDEEAVEEKQPENPPANTTQDNPTDESQTLDSNISRAKNDINSKQPIKRRKRKIKRKDVDYNHQTNVKLWEENSSDSTKITSTTTIEIRTNDDSVFSTLEDLPDFINDSITELTSSYIEQRMRQGKKGNRWSICYDSSSTSMSVNDDMQSSKSYDDYISQHEAYRRIHKLLENGTIENKNAAMYDEYHNIRIDDDIASSEEEFLSDLDDLDLTGWIPRESELRKQVGIILRKLNPLQYDYKSTVNDILRKYLQHINNKGRVDKIKGIVDCVEKTISQKEKTELLIKREIEDKKLNNEFYYSPMEPPDFTELCARRRDAIYRKYSKCEIDRSFCHSYFQKSLQLNRPISKLEQKIEELKRQMELIFA